MGNQKSIYRSYNSQRTDYQHILAINHDSSLLAVGVIQGEMKMFKILYYKQHNVENLTESEEEELYASDEKALTQLKIYGGDVGCVNSLQFLKSEKHINFFLSGSEHLIIIWSPNDQLNPVFWSQQFKIEWTYAEIFSCVIHPNENLIISCDKENVKFWQLQDNKYVCQQIISEHNILAYGLSISPDGNKIISIGADNKLIVMKGSDKETWQVVQKIQLCKQSFNICFITNQIFTLQSTNSGKGAKNLEIYKMDQNEQFLITKTIPLEGKNQRHSGQSWPIYSPSKQILTTINGHSLNIIRFIFYTSQYKGLEGEFNCQLEQVIDIDHQNSCGTMSPDGEILITWDVKSHLTKIKKYNPNIDKQY
ncbi:unnamed protein product [Paramecium sonneborni]|uniref:WD40-repeat-containing domain n=1 Tax=Paramecium sonneborni TaxID=65129 RepID=A0A8S1PGA3_9CILI|nr:unnamed protein product [Paramecium sonneborni]